MHLRFREIFRPKNLQLFGDKNLDFLSKKTTFPRFLPGKSYAHLFYQVKMVGEGGFEPPKSSTTDLQSAPFDRSGIPPYLILKININGAGGRI